MAEVATARGAPPFRELYRTHYGFVWHAVRRFGIEDAVLDDVVQDTFVTAYRGLSRFEGGSAKSWLYAIARRVASNYRRTGVRRRRRHDAWQQHTQDDHVASPALEALHTLEVFLRSLADDQREIFVLTELEGMSGGEVATTLAMPASTVYDRLRAVRASFRHHLDERGSVVLGRARDERPRATTRSWMLLCLRIPGAAVAALSSTTMATAATLVLGTTVVVGLGVVTAEAAPTRESPPVAVVAPTGIAPATVAPTIVAELPPVAAAIVSPSSPPVVKPTPRARPRATASTGDETTWLTQAAESLQAGDAAAALALTDRHARSFADSALADVRAELRIESLCRLGRTQQARGEAEAWLRRAPSSPLARRAASICREAP